ncbi:SF3 helicase domain-containing protein [Trichonephila clavata]|uniref:SF3 helicase domain-containing protein n=1 Tax=Trichonephila clavata TaxID=2740835 RepID=A0A8X6JMC6_TRICU|nr:SF3 helicase domain-containing protein [Trichonephila clavata]
MGKANCLKFWLVSFGGYYHCIQSDNLKPGSSSANPTPDLASTLFNCRISTTEELEGKLNENRVKQITGNSYVTFSKHVRIQSRGIQPPSYLPQLIIYPIVERPRLFKTDSLPFLSCLAL